MRVSNILAIIILALVVLLLGTWLLGAVLRMIFMALALIGLIAIIRVFWGRNNRW